jgi:DNA topoisomerase-1
VRSPLTVAAARRYENTVTVEPQVFANLREFCKGKKQGSEVFDKIGPTALNDHLKQFMDDLTAKVFRTFNASVTLEAELAKADDAEMEKKTIVEKKEFYDSANRQVAILCNHQRSVPKGHDTQIQKLDEKLQVRRVATRATRACRAHRASVRARVDPPSRRRGRR